MLKLSVSYYKELKASEERDNQATGSRTVADSEENTDVTDDIESEIKAHTILLDWENVLSQKQHLKSF